MWDTDEKRVGHEISRTADRSRISAFFWADQLCSQVLLIHHIVTKRTASDHLRIVRLIRQGRSRLSLNAHLCFFKDAFDVVAWFVQLR